MPDSCCCFIWFCTSEARSAFFGVPGGDGGGSSSSAAFGPGPAPGYGICLLLSKENGPRSPLSCESRALSFLGGPDQERAAVQSCAAITYRAGFKLPLTVVQAFAFGEHRGGRVHKA